MLNAATGDELWSVATVPWSGWLQGTQEVLVASECRRYLPLQVSDAATGERRWMARLPHPPRRTALYAPLDTPMPDWQFRGAFGTPGRTVIERGEGDRLLDTLRPGDVLMVWKLDRLSRSLRDLLTLLERLDGLGVGFRSLTEYTTTPAGRMLLQMLGAFAEFERERTREGLASARAAGRIGGRRPKLSPGQRDELVRGVQEERYSMAQAARLFGVHPATVGRLMAQAHAAENG